MSTVYFDSLVLPVETSKPENKVVVKIKSSAYSDKRGIHVKKSLMFMRKKCLGFNILDEDVAAIGVDEVCSRIVNLSKVEDGLYEVCICDLAYDRESGHLEDYFYKLIPLETIK